MTVEWLKDFLSTIDEDYEVKILNFTSKEKLDIANVKIDFERCEVVFEEALN